MKKESLLNIFKGRRFVLFFSAFTLIFSMFVFASAGGNISKYYLEILLIAVGVAILIIGVAIFIIVLFLFVSINKNHIRKIKNNKKLFLFGIIPFLITAVLILVVSIVSFLRVFRMSLNPVMNFFNWTLGVLFIYSALIVSVGIYFIFKKNKNIGYGFLKLGVSTFGICWVIYEVIRVLVTGPADYI